MYIKENVTFIDNSHKTIIKINIYCVQCLMKKQYFIIYIFYKRHTLVKTPRLSDLNPYCLLQLPFNYFLILILYLYNWNI